MTKNTLLQMLMIFSAVFQSGCGENNKAQEYTSSNILIDTVINYNVERATSKLSNKLKENSGLIYYRELIWTIEDAGGKPKLYSVKINSGKIKQKIEIIESDNKDWEDIAQDEKYIYIGDFGNNDGHKSVLRIYKISKSGIPWSGNFEVRPELIEFSYPDQVNYNSAFHRTNFDCEAFFCKDDSLFVFTKNWIDNKTNVYRIPTEEGSYIAEKCGSFNVNGLITGAGLSLDENKIVLCGYNNQLPFIWYFSEFKKNDFFSGNKIKLVLSSLFGAQIEGICFRNNDTIYLSNEKSNFLPAIYYLSASELEESLGIK